MSSNFAIAACALRLPSRYYEPTVLSSALVAGALSIAAGIAGR